MKTTNYLGGEPFPKDFMVDSHEVERLYRAVAEGEPKLEILHMLYSMFGIEYQLRPPADELRLAGRLAAGGGLKHG